MLYDVPMKFIYFDRLLFLNDDFELGLPIFFMNVIYIYYMYVLCFKGNI